MSQIKFRRDLKKLNFILVFLFLIALCSNRAKAGVNFSVNFDNGLDAQSAIGSELAYTDGTLPSLVTGYGDKGKAVKNTYGTTLKYSSSNLNQSADTINFKFQLPFNLTGDIGRGKITQGYSKIDVSTSSNYVYIADNSSDQIIRASMDGQNWDRLGGHGTGDGKFNFWWSGDVSVDSSTEFLYISDAGNSRIIKTKFDGSSWQAFSTGDRSPTHIHYDSDNDFIYYNDSNNSQLVKSKLDGSSLTTLSWDGIADYVTDIFYDPIDDFIYFSDSSLNRIGRVKIDGSELSTLGSEGSGIENFNLPYSISYFNEYIYVCDEDNHRIVKTKIDGTDWTTLGSSGIGEGKFNDAISLTYNSINDFIYILDEPYRYGGNDMLIKTKIDGEGWEGFGTQGTGTIMEADDFIYDKQNDNIYFSANSAQIIRSKKDGTGWQSIGSYGNNSEILNFLYLTGLDINNSTGDIYALDHYTNYLYKINPDGTLASKYKGPEGEGLSVPRGLSYDSSTDYLYTGDMDHHRIAKTKIDGTGWTTYGSYGSGIGQFISPIHVYHDKVSDYTYVSDYDNERVARFKFSEGNSSWEELDTSTYYAWGGPGFVVKDGTDSIFIGGSDNKIEKLNMDGTLEGEFVTTSWPGNPEYPYPVFYDNSDNTLYVSDSYNIYHCTESGEYIETITADPEKVLFKTSGDKPFEVTVSAYNGKFGLSLNKYELPISLSSTQTMTSGSWHDMKISFNRSTGTADVYLDNENIISQEELTSSQIKAMSNIGDYIYIGSDPNDPNRTFPGAIDDLTFGAASAPTTSITPTVTASSTPSPTAANLIILPETGTRNKKAFKY